MPNKYDVVLFDMDGTIADSDEMIVQSFYEMYDLYRNGNRSPREKIIYFSGPPIRITLKNEFPDQDVDKMVSEFVRISWDNYDKYVKAFPHVREIVTSLLAHNINVGVVTGKLRKSSNHCLEVMGVDDIITYMVCGDDVKNGKPDPEGIIQALEHFNVLDKKKVLYIGDNDSDYLASKNAGVDVALVKWGPREISKDISPDYWLNDFMELEDIIYD